MAQSYFDRKKQRDQDKLLQDHAGKMTADIVRAICVANEGYETPELNDKLYLHFKGFTHIAGLETYTGCKALWLESNAIFKIENISHLKELSALFLHNNRIKKIENLECLAHLRTLNLSNNSITKVEGLSSLKSLQTLNLSKNDLATYDSIINVTSCPSISSLDLGANFLEDEQVLEIFGKMPHLNSLVLKGNKVVSNTRNYRKRMINQLQQLAYLDDRPVFQEERRAAKAWGEGGLTAERKAKEDMRNAKRQEAADRLHRFRAWQKKQLEILQARRAAGEPDPGPFVSYNTGPQDADDLEEEEREAKTSKADGNIFTAAREITFGDTNRASLKERQAIKKAKEALKTAADKIVVEEKIADPSISQVKNEWTESLNSRLATLVRELKFDFEAVAKKISVEAKWANLTGDDCRVKWCSLDWEKYKKNVVMKSKSSSAKRLATDLSTNNENPPIPPSNTATVQSEVQTFQSSTEIPFEETDMDELD